MAQLLPAAVRTAGSVCASVCCLRKKHLLDTHWLVVVHVSGAVHCAVKVPVYLAPHAPVQVPWNAFGLAQPLNVP
jgi:hypothetical protein